MQRTGIQGCAVHIVCHSPRSELGCTDTKVVYRRYASLFFVCGIGSGDNELITLEIIHRYVEVLDRYFGNVSTPVPGADGPGGLHRVIGVRA